MSALVGPSRRAELTAQSTAADEQYKKAFGVAPPRTPKAGRGIDKAAAGAQYLKAFGVAPPRTQQAARGAGQYQATADKQYKKAFGVAPPQRAPHDGDTDSDEEDYQHLRRRQQAGGAVFSSRGGGAAQLAERVAPSAPPLGGGGGPAPDSMVCNTCFTSRPHGTAAWDKCPKCERTDEPVRFDAAMEY